MPWKENWPSLRENSQGSPWLKPVTAVGCKVVANSLQKHFFLSACLLGFYLLSDTALWRETLKLTQDPHCTQNSLHPHRQSKTLLPTYLCFSKPLARNGEQSLQTFVRFRGTPEFGYKRISWHKENSMNAAKLLWLRREKWGVSIFSTGKFGRTSWD